MLKSLNFYLLSMLKNLFNFSPIEQSKKITFSELLMGVTLGAVFGLIAIIPWVIVSNLGFFVSFLGYIIGLAVYKGFVLGAKKMHVLGNITIILVILLAIPFAEMIIILIQGIKYGFPFLFVLQNTPIVFFDSLGDIGLNIVLGYVFAFLGSWRIIFYRQTAPATTSEKKVISQ